MQYSPKLKKAMEDIKTILKENDIAGVVLLHTPGFSEYFNHLTTTYSCVEVLDNGLKLSLNSEEVGRERALEIANGTFNMMTHFNDHLGVHHRMYADIHRMLKDKWNGTESSGGHTSVQQQNN